MLYIGYVGLSVAFSFAVAALLEGKADKDWANEARPFILAAWSALTSVSRWVRGGPIMSWAGAAGGSGTLLKTPH